MIDKNALLRCAITDENLEEVRRLLKEGASPNSMDSNGETPLHLCAKSYYPDRDIAAVLIEHGADPSLENMSGKIISEVCKDKEFLGFVSERHEQYLKDIRLQKAVENGQWFDIADLLKNGARVASVDAKGNTALHTCALIKQGTLAAMYAIKMASILIQYGSDPEAQNFAEKTVYDLCDSKAFSRFIRYERNKYIEECKEREKRENEELEEVLNSLMQLCAADTKATTALRQFVDTPDISGINNIAVPVPQKEKQVFCSQ